MNSSTNKQKDAFEKLSRLKVGALFMEMGTGKTKVALDLIASKKDKVGYILWLCPFSLKNETRAEIKKWHPELELDIIGVESIGSSDRIFIEILNKVKSSQTFTVVDESLKIKNRQAKRTQRILMIGNHSKYKLILNGTPISKNTLDLWTQMEFLSPKILNMTYREFKDNYTEYYVRGRLKGLVKRQHNTEHLISKIKPYIFDAELDLNSKKHYYSYEYRMDPEERYEYEAEKTMLLNEMSDDSRIDFYRLMTTLQTIYTQAKERKEWLEELDIDGQAVVFVKYLKSIPVGALALTGELSNDERKKVIELFRNKESKYLYMTYGCGTYGLNLQFCHNMIFLDHSFDYSQRIQAEARIYRIGQEDDVNYYSFYCRVGLENMIRASLNKKTNLLREVKKEIEKKGLKEWVKNI